MNTDAAKGALAATDRRRAAAVSKTVEHAEQARLRLDPELQAEYAAHVERELKTAWARSERRQRGKHSGFKRGTPQCSACRRILTGYGAWCESCHAYSYGPRDGARASRAG